MSYRVTLSAPEPPALINLRARGEGRGALGTALDLELPTPSGIAAGRKPVLVFGLGPDEWLLRTPRRDESAWLVRLKEALSSFLASAVLVSDAYRVFRIAGPDCLDVLAQATGVDLDPRAFPTGRTTRTAFAKVSAIVHRVDERPAFDLYVDASLAAYVAKWLEAASGVSVPTMSCTGS